jgi:hypothetical protein
VTLATALSFVLLRFVCGGRSLQGG